MVLRQIITRHGRTVVEYSTNRSIVWRYRAYATTSNTNQGPAQSDLIQGGVERTWTLQRVQQAGSLEASQLAAQISQHWKLLDAIRDEYNTIHPTNENTLSRADGIGSKRRATEAEKEARKSNKVDKPENDTKQARPPSAEQVAEKLKQSWKDLDAICDEFNRRHAGTDHMTRRKYVPISPSRSARTRRAAKGDEKFLRSANLHSPLTTSQLAASIRQSWRAFDELSDEFNLSFPDVGPPVGSRHFPSASNGPGVVRHAVKQRAAAAAEPETEPAQSSPATPPSPPSPPTPTSPAAPPTRSTPPSQSSGYFSSYEDYLDAKKQQAEIEGYGFHPDWERPHRPWELLENPPAPEDLTLPMLIANQCHLGAATSLWHPANSSYIFGIREGIHIISLEITMSYLRRAAKVIQEVAHRGGLILFVGTKEGMSDVVVSAAKRAQGYHIFTRWVPGTLTNGQQILSHGDVSVVNAQDKPLPQFEEVLKKSESNRVLRPDLVVMLNCNDNEVCLHECGLYNVPTIGIVDTDVNPTWVTYPIPANDDSPRSVGLVAGVLSRAAERGQMTRRAAADKGETTYNTTPVHMYLASMEELAAAQVEAEQNAATGKDKAGE